MHIPPKHLVAWVMVLWLTITLLGYDSGYHQPSTYLNTAVFEYMYTCMYSLVNLYRAPPPWKLKRSGKLTVLKTRIREGVSGKIHTLTVQTPLGLLYGF